MSRNWMDFVVYLDSVEITDPYIESKDILIIARSGQLLEQYIVTHKVEINKFLENKE